MNDRLGNEAPAHDSQGPADQMPVDQGPADQIEDHSAGGGRRLAGFAVACEASLALLALGLGWLLNVPVWSPLKLDLEAILWGGVGTLPLIASLVWIDRYPFGPFRGLKEFMEQQITPLFHGCRWWQLAAIATAAGLGEELLCRGFLQQGLQLWLADHLGATEAMWTALIVASILFGLAHALTRMYVVVCIVIGFYLGGLFLVTENLLVPVIIHGLYDFVALVYLTRKSSESGPVQLAS